MSEHVNGRLRVSALVLSEQPTVRFIDAADGDLPIAKAYDPANARRIVASWNATLAIPTDTLESIATGHAVNSLLVYQNVLRERNDAVKALREYIAAADGCVSGEDDAAAMLRFGEADKAARDLLDKHKDVPA